MDREPHPDSSSKRFRWVGRPSEEQLLGLSTPTVRHRRVSFLAQPAPEVPAPREPGAQPEAHRRARGRDVVAVLALLAAVGFALHEADGRLPLRQARPAPIATVADIGSTQVSADRRELASLPRRSDGERGSASEGSRRHGGGSKDGSGSGSKDGSKDDGNPPPDETKNPPLLEANVPGVGSVTVEQPDVPLPVETPTLLDVGDSIPSTPTLPDAPTVP
jgi:hypothetical protein